MVVFFGSALHRNSLIFGQYDAKGESLLAQLFFEIESVGHTLGDGRVVKIGIRYRSKERLHNRLISRTIIQIHSGFTCFRGDDGNSLEVEDEQIH